jgi:hypothetical protein
MYFREETYAAVAGFVLGYDLACEGGVLVGFREWLSTRLMMGSNLGWHSLVLHACFPDAEHPGDFVHTNEDTERRAIDTLFDLLDEFESVRSKQDGLADILAAYRSWVENRRDMMT